MFGFGYFFKQTRGPDNFCDIRLFRASSASEGTILGKFLKLFEIQGRMFNRVRLFLSFWNVDTILIAARRNF
jgi:hypothetical protein